MSIFVDYVKCNNCNEDCPVDGDYPRYTAWCEVCNAEPGGWDMLAYAAEKLADDIDTTYDYIKDEGNHRE